MSNDSFSRAPYLRALRGTLTIQYGPQDCSPECVCVCVWLCGVDEMFFGRVSGPGHKHVLIHDYDNWEKNQNTENVTKKKPCIPLFMRAEDKKKCSTTILCEK